MEKQMKSLSVSILNQSRIANSTNPKHWRFTFNIPSDLGEVLDIENRRYAMVSYINGRVSLDFTDENIPEARPVHFRSSRNTGYVTIDQSLFGVEITETVKAKRFTAMVKDGDTVVFDFNPQDILKETPYVPATRKIKNKEDKKKAGFETDSSWGERLRATADKAITDQYLELLRVRLK